MAKIFKSISTIKNILKTLDLSKLQQLSQKVDLNEMMGLVSGMSEDDLNKMMKMMKGSGGEKKGTTRN